MSEQLLVDANEFETRVALVRNGAPVEIHLQRPAGEPNGKPGDLLGNIYLGRIAHLAPAIEAAFVDIGTDALGALFAEPEGVRRPWRQGDHIVVQVAREPLEGRGGQRGKGPRLSAKVSLVGRYVVALPTGPDARSVGSETTTAHERGADGGQGEPASCTQVKLSRRLADDTERERLAALLADVLRHFNLRWDCIVRTAAAGATRAQIEDDIAYLDGLWREILSRQRRTRTAPALLFEELPAMLRTVRDLAGPRLSAIVVNDDDACHAIHSHLAAHLPAYRDKVVRYRGALGLFDACGVEAAIDRILDPRVPLPSGGHIVIEHTEAMTTVDVNSGTGLPSATRADTALGTNLEAATAIARELRLRNIGGIVVVDFIGMATDAHRELVHRTLLEAADDDPGRIAASGFSGLGLVEISRHRVRDSVPSLLSGHCPACGGRGYAKSAQSTCFDLFRAVLRRAKADGHRLTGYAVHAAEVVVDRLLGDDAHHLAALGRRTGLELQLHVAPGYRTDQFDLLGLPRQPDSKLG